MWQNPFSERLEPYYHIFCWGCPGVLAGINLGLDSYGNGLLWCWIDSNQPLLRFTTFYLWLVVVFFVNLTLFILIDRSLRRDPSRNSILRKLRQYLIAFFLVRVWSLLNRLQNAFQPDDPSFTLYLLHAFFSPLQGFCNALLYGFNLTVRMHYRRLLCGESAATSDELLNTSESGFAEELEDYRRLSHAPSRLDSISEISRYSPPNVSFAPPDIRH